MPKATPDTAEVVETIESTDAPQETKFAKLKTIATNPKVLITAATVTAASVVLIVRSRNSSDSEPEAL